MGSPLDQESKPLHQEYWADSTCMKVESSLPGSDYPEYSTLTMINTVGHTICSFPHKKHWVEYVGAHYIPIHGI